MITEIGHAIKTQARSACYKDGKRLVQMKIRQKHFWTQIAPCQQQEPVTLKHLQQEQHYCRLKGRPVAHSEATSERSHDNLCVDVERHDARLGGEVEGGEAQLGSGDGASGHPPQPFEQVQEARRVHQRAGAALDVQVVALPLRTRAAACGSVLAAAPETDSLLVVSWARDKLCYPEWLRELAIIADGINSQCTVGDAAAAERDQVP